MKKILTVLIIILVVLAVLLIAKDSLIRSAVIAGTTQILGAPAQIDRFAVGLLRQSVQIKGFRMYNPKGFPEGIFVDIPEISVEYDLGAILKKKIHLKKSCLI